VLDEGWPPAASRAMHRRLRSSRRWYSAAAWVIGALIAFAVYLRLASTRAVNSDGSTSSLQAWNMLHGNVLLHGWTLGDASFYLTELPEYMLVELVRGLSQDVVHVAAALTYTLALLCAALLAKGQATGRAAAARVGIAAGIMLAPQLNSGTDLFLSSPDHFGTSVPVLLAWLILDRARPRWYVPLITSLLLAWAEVGDMLVLVIGVAPLVIVCGARILRAVAVDKQPLAAQRYDVALAAGAVLAAVTGVLALVVIHDLGGFYAVVPGTQLAPASTIVTHNARVTADGLLMIAGAYSPGGWTALGALHLAGVVLAACAVGVTAWRFARDEDLVAQLLLAGIVLSVGVFLVSVRGESILYTHDMVPVLPLAAALAGRQLGGRVLAVRLAPALTSVLGLVLCGYWGSSVVTVTSGGQVSVRPVQAEGGQLRPKLTLVNAAWYDPGQSSADFVVLFPGIPVYPGLTDRAAVLATFGKPAWTYHVGQYTILVWDKNLLASLPGTVSRPGHPGGD
jgi:hypothetical protein